MDTASLWVTWVAAGGTTTAHQWLSEDGRFTVVALEGPGDLGGVGVIDNIRGRLRTAYPYPGGADRTACTIDQVPDMGLGPVAWSASKNSSWAA